VVECFRRLVLACALGLLSSSSALTAPTVGLVICLAFLYVFIKLEPYQSGAHEPHLNHVGIVLAYALTLFFLAALLLKASPDVADQAWFAALLMALLLSGPAAIALALWHNWHVGLYATSPVAPAKGRGEVELVRSASFLAFEEDLAKAKAMSLAAKQKKESDKKAREARWAGAAPPGAGQRRGSASKDLQQILTKRPDKNRPLSGDDHRAALDADQAKLKEFLGRCGLEGMYDTFLAFGVDSVKDAMDGEVVTAAALQNDMGLTPFEVRKFRGTVESERFQNVQDFNLTGSL
jgi:hypothetical protein